jgi:WD40 repeat protein
VSGSDDTTLRVWDLQTGECVHVLEGHSDHVYCLQVNSRRFS